jgi:hypothetical protein
VIEPGAPPDAEGVESEGESLVLSTVGNPWPDDRNGGEGGIRTRTGGLTGSETAKTCEGAGSAPSLLASLNSGQLGPELARIVAAWPTLRPELRVAILAIVASTDGGPSA